MRLHWLLLPCTLSFASISIAEDVRFEVTLPPLQMQSAGPTFVVTLPSLVARTADASFVVTLPPLMARPASSSFEVTLPPLTARSETGRFEITLPTLTAVSLSSIFSVGLPPLVVHAGQEPPALPETTGQDTCPSGDDCGTVSVPQEEATATLAEPTDVQDQLRQIDEALGGGLINPFCPPMDRYLAELGERDLAGENVNAQYRRVEEAVLSATPLLMRGGPVWCDHITQNMK